MLVGIDPESSKKANSILTSLLSSPGLPAWVEVAILNKQTGKCIRQKITGHLITAAIFLYRALRPCPVLYALITSWIRYWNSVFIDVPLKSIKFLAAFAKKNKLDLFFKRFIGFQCVMYTILLLQFGVVWASGDTHFYQICYNFLFNIFTGDRSLLIANQGCGWQEWIATVVSKDMGTNLQCDLVNPAKCTVFPSREKE